MSRQTYGGRIGAALRLRRRSLGLTQTEVAELAGTTQRTVSEVEAGKASGLSIYAAVAEVLGMTLVAVPRQPSERSTTGDGSVS